MPAPRAPTPAIAETMIDSITVDGGGRHHRRRSGLVRDAEPAAQCRRARSGQRFHPGQLGAERPRRRLRPRHGRGFVTGGVTGARYRRQPAQRLPARRLHRRRRHRGHDPRQPVPGRRVGARASTGWATASTPRPSSSPITDNTFDGIYAGVVNVFPFGTEPGRSRHLHPQQYLPNNAGERPIQVYPTNDVHEIFGTEENEAFSADLAVTDYGVTNASFTFHGHGGNDHIYGHDGRLPLRRRGRRPDLRQRRRRHAERRHRQRSLYGEAGIDTALCSTRPTQCLYRHGSRAGSSSPRRQRLLSGVEIAVAGSGQRNLLVGGTGFATLQAARPMPRPATTSGWRRAPTPASSTTMSAA